MNPALIYCFLTLVFPFLALANEPLRPTNLSQFGIEKEQKYYRVPGAQVVWVDFQRMRADFPGLKNFSDAAIENWIFESFAFVSESQLRLRGIRSSDFIIDANQVRTFSHPDRYRRASLAQAFIEGKPSGLVDLKGSGHIGDSRFLGKNAFNIEKQIRFYEESAEDPQFRDQLLARDHSDGLMSLGEGIAEVSRQQALQALFDIHKNNQQTVESYFLIDLGFDILKPGGEKIPAGIIGRQSHIRGRNAEDRSGFYKDDHGKFQRSASGARIDMGGVQIVHPLLQQNFVFYGDSDNPQNSKPWSEGHRVARLFRERSRTNIFEARHEVYSHIQEMLKPVLTAWNALRWSADLERGRALQQFGFLTQVEDEQKEIAEIRLQELASEKPEVFIQSARAFISDRENSLYRFFLFLYKVPLDFSVLEPALIEVMGEAPQNRLHDYNREYILKFLTGKKLWKDDVRTVHALLNLTSENAALSDLPWLATEQLKKMHAFHDSQVISRLKQISNPTVTQRRLIYLLQSQSVGLCSEAVKNP